MRVPLILRGPGVTAGTTVSETARSIDIVPTILDLVGMNERCGRCQGRSLLPAIEGEAASPEPSYSETYFPRLNLGWSELRSLRVGTFKYIDAPEPELYDVAADPGELRNLAAWNPEKVRELDSELDRLEKATAGAAAKEEILDPQIRVVLRSLGYLSSEGSVSVEGPRPDPKSRLAVWEGVRTGMDLTARGRDGSGYRRARSPLSRPSPTSFSRGPTWPSPISSGADIRPRWTSARRSSPARRRISTERSFSGRVSSAWDAWRRRGMRFSKRRSSTKSRPSPGWSSRSSTWRRSPAHRRMRPLPRRRREMETRRRFSCCRGRLR